MSSKLNTESVLVKKIASLQVDDFQLQALSQPLFKNQFLEIIKEQMIRSSKIFSNEIHTSENVKFCPYQIAKIKRDAIILIKQNGFYFFLV